MNRNAYLSFITHTLDKSVNNQYNILAIGVWRSLVSRLVRVQEASGSNPDTPTKIPVTTSVVAGIFSYRDSKGGNQSTDESLVGVDME